MGDGTEESHARAQAAIDHLWRYTHELFYEDAIDAELQAAAQVPSLKAIETSWLETVKAVFAEATLEIPANNWKFDGGRQGRHSEHMGYLLAELQYMQRAYPNMQW
jgi:ring-1,2-phenylacetyl-CoA epoxidase subunit PaaC